MSDPVRLSEKPAKLEELDALEECEREESNTNQSEPVDGFSIPIVLALIGSYLLYGLTTMEVSAATAWPGPKMFPSIVTILLFAVAISMSVKAIIGRRTRAKSQESVKAMKLDWPAVATVAISFLVFAIVVVPLGWILSGAILFWGVAIGLGSRSWLKDALISLGISSLVQVCFSAGLGLNLPSGILGLI